MTALYFFLLRQVQSDIGIESLKESVSAGCGWSVEACTKRTGFLYCQYILGTICHKYIDTKLTQCYAYATVYMTQRGAIYEKNDT